MYYEDWSGVPEPNSRQAGTTGIMRYVMAQAPYTTADALTMPSRLRVRDIRLNVSATNSQNAKGGFRF